MPLFVDRLSLEVKSKYILLRHNEVTFGKEVKTGIGI